MCIVQYNRLLWKYNKTISFQCPGVPRLEEYSVVEKIRENRTLEIRRGYISRKSIVSVGRETENQ